MSDLFFQSFYENVKDPSWPCAENYCDFVKLPQHIKDECYNKHRLAEKLEQIEDADYWFDNLLSQFHHVYQHKNLIFLPVPKCGSQYYDELFERMGWKKIKIKAKDFDNNVIFAPVMHPLSRYLKGLTEWVWRNNLIEDYDNLIEQKMFVNLMSELLIADVHTVPYTYTFRHLMSKVHWIPMDNFTDNEVKQIMMNLFKKHNHNIELPLNEPRIHESNKDKLKIYQAVKHLYQNKKLPNLNIYLIYIFFAEDLKFYRHLVDNFDPSWSSNTH